jgi:DNA mismatch repair protein MutS
MMQQYMKIKQQYSDCMLFFRLGDFYELFLDDALLGARLLGITLTKRPRGKDGDIPMAGVPYHAAATYISKLIKLGHRVAICEQVSLPNSKSIVERAVVRIITPGTVLDDQSLLVPEHNFILAVAFHTRSVGVAVADVSTGLLKLTEFERTEKVAELIARELQRFAPSECIVSVSTYSDPELLGMVIQSNAAVSAFDQWKKGKRAVNVLNDHFSALAMSSLSLNESSPALESAASLLAYIEHTQQQTVEHFSNPEWYSSTECLLLDASTMRNLELFSTIRNADKKGSLYGLLDQTNSAAGARLLRRWLGEPLLDKDRILARHDAVAELVQQQSKRAAIRAHTAALYDIERQLAKLSLRLATPAAIINIAQSLEQFIAIHGIISTFSASFWQPHTEIDTKKVAIIIKYVYDHLNTELIDGTAIRMSIKFGVSRELDLLRDRVQGGEAWLLEFEQAERKRTGINSLKCKYNSVFGYYIEISNANLDAVPSDYTRKQTLVNAERFITPELKAQEELVLSAQEKIDQLELALFQEIVDYVTGQRELIMNIAHVLAELDVISTFAEISYVRNYCQPSMVETGELKITAGRHPVVESLVAEKFVPNDVLLNPQSQQMLIITGPNMAGKSVFMRQVALIVLMSHLGCFVPAQAATIPITDRIFVRSGASDSISDGLSTFMVEMVETAAILNNVTENSLIVMDEIGRGTSTYDGISIASAIAEYLAKHPSKPKVLFATHYHELQSLAITYPDQIHNYQVAVERHQGKPLFLYTMIPGESSHSFGVAVAALAGVPDLVVKRAEQLLSELESSKRQSTKHSIPNNGIVGEQRHPVINKLLTLDLTTTTPLDALNALAEYQKELKDGED